MLKQLIQTIILLMLVFPSLAATQNSVSAKQNQLGQLAKDIKVLQHNLESSQHKRNTTIGSLKKTDLDIASASKLLTSFNTKISLQTQSLEKLKQQAVVKQQALATQQVLLQHQIRTAYALGKNGYLKILLNQEDPAAISRIKSYYHYLNQARLHVMGKIEKLLQEIAENQQQIISTVQQLEALKKQQQQKKHQLQQLKSQQGEIVNKLSQQITSNQQHLTQLIANKKALEDIIQNLKRVNRPAFADLNKPFAKEHGRLHWPTTGTIAKHFGTPIGQSQLFYSGVLIATKAGQAVYAVHRGRVVFAEWLKGFGLLLIVEHDHGYMTLYAHNDNLYKKSGEIVQGGEIIAAAGNSGGNLENGLYFEIRANGKPQNPESWLNKNRSF